MAKIYNSLLKIYKLEQKQLTDVVIRALLKWILKCKWCRNYLRFAVDESTKLAATFERMYCGVFGVQMFVRSCAFTAMTFPFGIRGLAATGVKHLCNADNREHTGTNLSLHLVKLLLLKSSIYLTKINLIFEVQIFDARSEACVF